MTPRPRPYHRAEAERLLDYADEWAVQAEEPAPEAGELSCVAYAAVHALLAIHDTLTAADRYAANEAKQREAAQEAVGSSPDNPFTLPSVIAPEGTRFTPHPTPVDAYRAAAPDPLDESDHRDRLDKDGCIVRRKGRECWAWPEFDGFHDAAGCSLSSINASDGPLAFAPDADGAPSATAPVDDDPADDAVDGEEGERRYLNAQTVRETLAIVGRWAGKCLHEWAEDTCVGDTTRHFICTECGITRTEERQ